MRMKTFNFPIDATLHVIGGKWKCSILCHLMEQPRRTGELRKMMFGISQKVLTEQLRELENDGLIQRTIYPEIPPRVEYRMTELGISLQAIIFGMCDWGSAHLEHITAALNRNLDDNPK